MHLLPLIIILAGATLLSSCNTRRDVMLLPDTTEISSSFSTEIHQPLTVADGLTVPWDIAFLPSGDLLVTERSGTLVRIGAGMKRFPIEGVYHRGEGGLLGLELHPHFASNGWIYLYLTTTEDGDITNRIDRYVLTDDELVARTTIMTDIPGSTNHDGGSIRFGPDGKLYVTTGDAGNPALAQDKGSLAGKILRVNDDGTLPFDNPFGTSVFSYGHRNPQGITWDDEGRLWSTEHGRSGVLSGFDELNLIVPGANHGWPTIQGSESEEGLVSPVLHSGSDDTWAPASAAYLNGSIFFGGLRGEALYEAVLTGASATLKKHLHGSYGRIRTVRVGPDGSLYLTTSNTDGRGRVRSGDDRILKIDPAMLR